MGYFMLSMPQYADERPEKTFYYERKDGKVFACNVKEAHAIHTKYKQFGVSDSLTFFHALKKAVEKQNAALAKLGPEKNSKKWRDQRQLIATNAQQDLKNAALSDQKKAKGHLENPADNSGTFFGDFSQKDMDYAKQLTSRL